MKVNLRTISEHEEVRLAESEMTHDEISHLLVVDMAGKLVGLVSDRDLRRARSSDDKIASIMTRQVLVVAPTTSAAFAAERLLRDKYDALPVVDSGGHLLGIVTRTDFVDLAYRALVGLDPFAKRVHA